MGSGDISDQLDIRLDALGLILDGVPKPATGPELEAEATEALAVVEEDWGISTCRGRDYSL